jgi:thioredoxin-like negative regulator of GroEL
MQCEHYEEALPLLYKASFLDEESPLVKMQLAWCLIVNGKKEEAMKFVFELQTEDTTREDAAILLGIVMLLDGKVKEAYDQLHPLINANNKADTMQKLDTLCRQKLLQRTTLTLFTDALVLHIQ